MVDRWHVVSNINNGSFSGPALSGTVLGGVSVFDIINNGSVLVNKVRNYGITLDGVPFFIDEDGTGSQADDFTRLVCIQHPAKLCLLQLGRPVIDKSVQTISIGGKYAYLANQLVIASAKLSSDKKIVTSTAYLVSEG